MKKTMFLTAVIILASLTSAADPHFVLSGQPGGQGAFGGNGYYDALRLFANPSSGVQIFLLPTRLEFYGVMSFYGKAYTSHLYPSQDNAFTLGNPEAFYSDAFVNSFHTKTSVITAEELVALRNRVTALEASCSSRLNAVK